MSRDATSLERCWRSLAASALLAALIGACSTAPAGSHWGADATISPGWERIVDAAATAAKDPFTWAPAVGAAALQIGDSDQDIAGWANEETPVFGSRESASDASDWLRTASVAAYVGTGLAAPAPHGEWLRTKAKGFAVGASAIGATIGTTVGLKEVTDRERPLGQDSDSFPSRHASVASVSARLTHEALRYYDLSPGARIAADAGLVSVAVATGWARVEAGEHHPADALAGAALGNFIAVFATEAFLQPAAGGAVSLRAVPARGGMGIQLSTAF